MKKITLLIILMLASTLGFSQVDVNFDATTAWGGFMSVSANPKDGSVGSSDFAQGWGVSDLVAVLDGGTNTVTLKPNRVNDAAAFWNTSGQFEGNRIMEASMTFVDNALRGNMVNFIGNVNSNTLDDSSLAFKFTVVAFVRVFSSDFSSVLSEQEVDITSTGDFTVSLDASSFTGTENVQYGFTFTGPNINNDASFNSAYDALGSLVVGAQVNTNTDATLSDLQVDGMTINNFSPNTADYTYEVASGGGVPTVTATAAQAGNGSSAVSITPAGAVPGTTNITVTAPDGTTQQMYSVEFVNAILPSSAAPAPPTFNNASDFISLFSNPSDDISTTRNAFGATGVIEEVTVEGNPTLRLTGGTAGDGFQFILSSGIDLTDYTDMYFNFWVEGSVDAGEIIQAFLQNFDGSNAFQNNVIANFDPATLGTGTWVTVNMPTSGFADFANGASNIRQIQLVTAGGDGFGPVFFDNVIFYRAGTASTGDNSLIEASAFPNPTDGDWTINTPNNIIQSVQVFNLLGKQVLARSNNSGSVTILTDTLSSGVYLARVITDAGTTTMKLIKN